MSRIHNEYWTSNELFAELQIGSFKSAKVQKANFSQFLKLVNYQYEIQRISLSLQHFQVLVQKLLTQETSASQINEKKIQVNGDIHIEIETRKYNLEFAVCTCIFT